MQASNFLQPETASELPCIAFTLALMYIINRHEQRSQRHSK